MYRGRREPPLAVQVRDRLGELFPDAAFADAFGRVGKPGWSPGRLALVTVLQKASNLTDRQAADEVRENLSWKYALGLTLDDPGFDHSVLSEFRTRVVEHALEERVLDLLLERLRDVDLVQAGGGQRTDFTHIVAACAALDCIPCPFKDRCTTSRKNQDSLVPSTVTASTTQIGRLAT
ncbi:transposase [Streptomyces sp. NPDC055722]